MAGELPKALSEPDWWDKMIAPGTVGGMFAEGAKKVGNALELTTPAPATTPVATPAPAPAVVPTAAAPAAAPAVPMSIPTVEHSQSATSSVVHDPKAVKKIESAQADVQASVLEGAKIGAAKAAEIATIRDAGIQHQKELEAQHTAEELAQTQRVDTAILGQQQMLDDLSKTKKDPEKLWKEKGFFAQAMAGLGVALGSFGSGLTGGPNHALNIVNSAIEHSLNAQESEIQLKRDKVNMQGNLIAQLRQSKLDDRTARSMARQHLLEQTASTLEAKAASAPAEIMQNAMTTVAQLRAQAAEEADKRKEIAIQSTKAKAPAYSPMDLRKMNDEDRKRFVPDAGGLAPSEGQAAEMNKYAAAHNSVVGDIAELKKMVDQHGNVSLPTTTKAKMTGLFKRIVVAMNKDGGLGAMSGSDRELIEGQIADPTAFWTRGVKTSEQLQNLIETMGRAKLNTYKAYGLAAQ